ncbi:MAG: sigma 54-interacting transcriptional regulator [Pirellulaceae bacterium]
MSPPHPHTDTRSAGYLVIRHGGRWTDVLRLVAGRRIIIGRASSSQIVVRSDRCSRQHAEIFSVDGKWILRDLGSRNGTFVDGRQIEEDHPLAEGETVEVAICQMSFVTDIADAFSGGSGPVAPASQVTASGASEDQRTVEGIDSPYPMITHRRDSSSYLDPSRLALPDPAAFPNPPPAIVGQTLFQLAFDLARCDSIRQAATVSLEGLAEQTQVASGALLIDRSASTSRDATAENLTVVTTLQRGERSYHRLPDLLAKTVLQENEAVLARNLVDDAELASPDSRGAFSTTSAICAPVRLADRPIGLLHVYSAEDERELTPDDLEFVVAVADNLSLAIRHLQRQRQLSDSLSRTRRRVDQLREQLADTTKIVGSSRAIQQVKEQIQRAGPTGATVLVRGESGTGKELVAAAIHAASSRRDAPFVCLNCAALSASLLESELFGHEKGAFTGATDRKIGKFEAADGGTLMLDEIGEMSPEIQAKFLRVLEGHSFERVGGNQPIKVDVRVVAATNRDLEQAVRDGSFRADLYYRLNVVEIVVPPLRERRDDVLVLADFFLQRFANEMGRRISTITSAGRQRLREYTWPGNVRELKNAIERAVVLCPGSEIDVEDLTLSNVRLEPQSAGEMSDHRGDAAAYDKDGSPAMISLEEMEKRHIVAVLKASGGNKSRSASVLGIERSTLDRKIRKYELDPQQWRD